MVYERKPLKIRTIGKKNPNETNPDYRGVNNNDWINLYGSKITITLPKNVQIENQRKHENNNVYDFFSYDTLDVFGVQNPIVKIYGVVSNTQDNNENNTLGVNTLKYLYELFLTKSVVEVQGDIIEFLNLDSTSPFYIVISKIEIRPENYNSTRNKIPFVITGYKINV